METYTFTLTEAERKCLRQILNRARTDDNVEDVEYFVTKLDGAD